MHLTSWGNYPQIKATLHTPDQVAGIQSILQQEERIIPRGNGRCYGDSALQLHAISTLSLNKERSFDPGTGIIQVEAGMLLDELLQIVVPAGWFLPVVPGTKMITIGGAIASNVHGKNHHQRGAFGEHVRSFELITADGQLMHCSPQQNTRLFSDTIGGLGYTGIIVSAEVQLIKSESSYYHQRSIKADSLNHLLKLFTLYLNSDYLVAWLDGLAPPKELGRGVLHMGFPSSVSDLPSRLAAQAHSVHTLPKLTIPKLPVSWCINPLSLHLNNTSYRWQHRKSIVKCVHYNQFFFPLDALDQWSRLYGPAGLLQYQFVVPFEAAYQCLLSVLEAIHMSGIIPYLVVLKRMGQSSPLAAATDFPMPGYSLAVDFKNTPKVHALLNTLDELVIQNFGRVYLTKDARLPAAAFAQMYPDAQNIPGRFRSLQAERIYDL